MTPAIEPEVVVEYHFRCFCGESIVATGRTVTCQRCGETLNIREVKEHRRHWNLVPLGVARNGWRWRKNVVESVVERRFYLQCPCGATTVTAEKRATCTACGKALALRRVTKPDLSRAVVEYDFACCFCAAPIVTTSKTVTCANCGKALKVVRVGTHGVFWKAVPCSADKDARGQGDGRTLTNDIPLYLFLVLSLCCVCYLALYVFDVANG